MANNLSLEALKSHLFETLEGVKKALEDLFRSEGTSTIYIEKVNGELFPVANVERHPDCPKHIYEAWIKSMIQ